MHSQREHGSTHRVSPIRVPQSERQASPVDAAMLWSTFAPALAGGARVRHAVRRAHGRVAYPTSHERDLTDSLPNVPAAVRVYGADGCCVALHLDFDAKGAFSPAHAERDARQVIAVLATLGLRWISDVSPGGGRHIYLPLANRMPFLDARSLVEGLARRFPTLDPGPHQSASTGCIRVPGAAHAAGGYQELDMTFEAATSALAWPNTADDIETLSGMFAIDIQEARRARIDARTEPLDVDVSPERTGPLRPISARLTAIARHGTWDGDRYLSASDARQAVIAGCVAQGWTLVDIHRRMGDGTWPGLASFYAKYRDQASVKKALATDVRNARSWLILTKDPAIDGKDHVRISNTSAPLTRGGSSPSDPHGDIRTWRAVLETFEGIRLQGRRWYAARFLLRALGEAAHKSGSLQVAYGCRSLAQASGMDHSTVSVLLRSLEKHGWIKKITRGWGEQADVWELTVPQDLVPLADSLRWPKGKVHALRPAFRSLGHVCAFVFEAVENDRARTITDLSRRLSMARSTVHEAVDMLLSWRLLERDSQKQLTAHPERLNGVAEYLGVDLEIHEQMMRHRQQRALWRAFLARFENDDYADAMTLADGWAGSAAGLEIEAA